MTFCHLNGLAGWKILSIDRITCKKWIVFRRKNQWHLEVCTHWLQPNSPWDLCWAKPGPSIQIEFLLYQFWKDIKDVYDLVDMLGLVDWELPPDFGAIHVSCNFVSLELRLPQNHISITDKNIFQRLQKIKDGCLTKHLSFHSTGWFLGIPITNTSILQ